MSYALLDLISPPFRFIFVLHFPGNDPVTNWARWKIMSIFSFYLCQQLPRRLRTGHDLLDSASSPVDAGWKQTYIRVITMLPTSLNNCSCGYDSESNIKTPAACVGCPRTIRSDKFLFKRSRKVPSLTSRGLLCVASACSPWVCVGSLRHSQRMGAPTHGKLPLKSVPETVLTPTIPIFSSVVHLSSFHVFLLGKRNNPTAFLVPRQNFSLSDNFPALLSLSSTALSSSLK